MSVDRPSLGEPIPCLAEAVDQPDQDLDTALKASLALVGLDHFAIENIAQAEWAIEKLAEVRSKVDYLTDFKDQAIQKVTDWYDQEVAPLARRVRFFTDLLTDYALQEREETGDKTLTLPSGRVATRASAAHVSVFDSEAFVAWARQNGRDDLLRFSPDRTATKKARWAGALAEVVDPETGEVVPGLTWVEETVTATVHTEGEL